MTHQGNQLLNRGNVLLKLFGVSSTSKNSDVNNELRIKYDKILGYSGKMCFCEKLNRLRTITTHRNVPRIQKIDSAINDHNKNNFNLISLVTKML